MANPSSDSAQPSIEELVDDFAERCRRGENPTIDEYAERYPELADRIRRLFPMMQIMEQHQPPVPPSLAAPEGLQELGDFTIIREIGRGGMGIVYEAEQQSLGRRVALKVLPTHAVLTPQHVERFEREARAAARLHHTNIVPVFGVGEHNGLHYYVMQVIAGVGLDEVLEQLRTLDSANTETMADVLGEESTQVSAVDVARGLVRRSGSGVARSTAPGTGGSDATAGSTAAAVAPQDRAEEDGSSLASTAKYWRNVADLGIQIANALEYAHRQGVMHRDIKPSNILLDTDGMAWVTDFGLAKDEQNVDLTQTGDIIGTLRYMAPERLSGTADARSEVYALGLTLYELLTMRPAYDQLDRDRLIDSLLNLDPPRPRKENPQIPRDLETIVMKAINREPHKRYNSAAALSQDLQNFVEGRPIQARRITPIGRLAKWVRRRPAIAALSAALVVVAAIGIGGVAWQWHQTDLARVEANEKGKREVIAQQAAATAESLRAAEQKQRQTAEHERQRAETAESLNHRLAYIADVRLAQHAFVQDDVDEALRILDRYLPQDGEVDERGPEWHYLRRLCQPELLTIKTGSTVQSNLLHCARFSPSGTEILFGSIKGIQVFDAQTGKAKRTLPRGGSAVFLNVSPKGDLIAQRDSRNLTIREFPSGKVIRKVEARSQGVHHPVVFDRSGTYVAWCVKNRVRIADARTGKSIVDKTLDDIYTIATLDFSSNNLFIGTDGRGAREMNVRGEIVNEYPSHSTPYAISTVGRFVAITYSEKLEVWDRSKKSQVFTVKFKARSQLHGPLTASRIGTGRLAVVDGAIVKMWAGLWRAPTVQPEMEIFRGHRTDVISIDYDNAGKRLLTCSMDGTLKVWDASGNAQQNIFRSKPQGRPLAFDQGAKKLALSAWDTSSGRRIATKKVAVIDVDARKVTTWLPNHRGPVRSADFSPDSKRLATCDPVGNVTVWDLNTRKRTYGVTLKSASVVRFSPDGKWLAIGLPGKILLSDMASAKIEIPLRLSHVSWIAFHPDGDIVAAAEQATSFVDLCRLSKGRVERELDPELKSLYDIVFSPDGKRLVAGGDGIVVWRTDDWSSRLFSRAPRRDNEVCGLCFSPDSERLVVGIRDGKGEIWDAETGRLSASFLGVRGSPYLNIIGFAKSGFIHTASDGGHIRFWDCRPVDD